MKRIKNADINFKLNPKRINLKSFSMRFYTVNSKAYFFIKDQDNVVSVERDATVYDDPEVIISGGTVAVDYYLPLDWSDLVQLGEGVLNYRCINNIDDPYFPDLVYNQVVEDTTAYYIDSDIHIDPAEDDKNLIERVIELESNLAVETADREDADVFLSGAVDTEIARAISAETELSERIDAIESGASEALDDEIARAEAAEAALQDAIDAEEARAIAIENAIRQDLTDESELRSSADTAMWTAINDETTRATSAETAIENKVDVETLRAIGVENAISGDLQTYKATNNAALQAETTRATSAETKIATDLSNYITSNNHALADEVSRATSAETALNNALTAETAARESEVTRATAAENAISGVVDNYITTNNAAVQGEITRATSAETALQNAIGDEATARANADAALGTRIDNISSASTAAIEAEAARAQEAESGLTNAINNEVTRATSAETIIANSINAEINRASSAETALNNQIDAEVLRATAKENDLEAKIGVVSGVTELINAETLRATTAENALDEKIGNVSGSVISEEARAISAETALDNKINTVSGNVLTEEARAKGVENALSGAIDTLDVRFFDDAKYEDSGNTKVINFYNGNVVKATIDCTDFLVDGMIDDVYIENGYLVIDFNTASGKQDIRIPLTDIFNPANYYTKSETSGATEIATALSQKLGISDFNTYSGAVDTLINSKASQSTVDALNNVVTAHTADTSIHVTSNDKEKWNKVDDKADSTALTAVNDALTAHTSDSTIHLTSGNVQTQIDNSISGKANSSDVYLKTETSGATEIATALAGKSDTGHTHDDRYYTKSETSGATEISTALASKANSSDVYLKSETSGATEIATALSGKQATLVSGTNIKTINNESILGSGNIDIQSGSDINVVQTTGTSTADVMSQDAVTTQLNNKANKTAAFGGYGFGSSSDGDYIQYKTVNNANIGNSIYYPKINGKGILTSNNIYARNNYNFELVETSAITTSVTSASTDSQIPSAKAVYDAIQEGGGSITVDSALDSGSTNPVENQALFDELRIVESGTETETALEWSGNNTTNYPSGCTEIKLEGDTSANASFQVLFYNGDEAIGSAYIMVNGGEISVTINNIDATYEISGSTVIISYPTVTNVTHLTSWWMPFTIKAVTRTSGSVTTLKNQVSANTAALDGKVDTTTFNSYASSVDSALNGKLDATAYTPTIVDSALDKYSDNPLKNSALFDELRIASGGTGTTDVALTLESGTITNYPTDCRQIKILDAHIFGTYFISFSFYDAQNLAVGSLSISGNNMSYTYQTDVQGMTYEEPSGYMGVILISYPTVSNIAKIDCTLDDATKWSLYAVMPNSTYIPLINQVSANTTSIAANTADIATVSGNVNTISGDVATNTSNIATVSAATASNTTALGGLKLQQISQSDYDNLQTKDSSTLYIII